MRRHDIVTHVRAVCLAGGAIADGDAEFEIGVDIEEGVLGGEGFECFAIGVVELGEGDFGFFPVYLSGDVLEVDGVDLHLDFSAFGIDELEGGRGFCLGEEKAGGGNGDGK